MKPVFLEIKIFFLTLAISGAYEKIRIQLPTTICLNPCLLRLSWIVELRQSREAESLF